MFKLGPKTKPLIEKNYLVFEYAVMPVLNFSIISSICFFSQINGGAIIKQSPVALKFTPIS